MHEERLAPEAILVLVSDGAMPGVLGFIAETELIFVYHAIPQRY